MSDKEKPGGEPVTDDWTGAPDVPQEQNEDDRTPSTITVIDTRLFPSPNTPPLLGLGSAGDSGSSSSARYEIRRTLGSGGFGTVSLAWDSTLQREVAIKRPAAQLSADLRQSYLAEARLAAKVKHPGIVVVHDVGVDQEGHPFVVYEYLAGTNLREQMAQHRFTLSESLDLILSLADALAAAHQQGLTHRDLKPANVLIDTQGRPHIADFGLAIEHEGQGELRGQVAGTNRYMSPEQVRGESHHLDGRTDLWSLGVIFYELLTGQTPFPGKQDQVFEQILHREPRPPRQWQSNIPRSVELIVMKLLAKPIAQRYASASDLADDLRAALVELKAGAGRELSNVSHNATHPQRANSRSFELVLLAGGVILLAVVLLVGIATSQGWFRATDDNPRAAASGKARDGRSDESSNSIPAPETERPFTDQDFPDGRWVELLTRGPGSILFSAKDTKVWTPGELLWVRAQYPALLELGETKSRSYSLRVTLETDKWDGNMGLMLGLGPSPIRPQNDAATLVGITKLNGQVTISLRTMELQRRGVQRPEHFNEPVISTSAIDPPADDKATILVDVVDGQIAGVFLNTKRIEQSPAEALQTFPTQGKFGVFIFGKTGSFSHAEFRRGS